MAEDDRMVGFGRVGKDAQDDIDKSKGGASILDEPNKGSASAYRRREEERSEINKAVHDERRRQRQSRIMYRKALRSGDIRGAAAVHEKQKNFGAARMAGDDAVAAGERVAQKEGAIEGRPGNFNADQKALQEDLKRLTGGRVDTSTPEGKSIARQIFEGREGTRTAHDRRKLLGELVKDPDFKKNLPGVRYHKDPFDRTKDATDAAGNKLIDTGQKGPAAARDVAGQPGAKGKEGEKGKEDKEEEEEEEKEETDVESGYSPSGGSGPIGAGGAAGVGGIMEGIRSSVEGTGERLLSELSKEEQAAIEYDKPSMSPGRRAAQAAQAAQVEGEAGAAGAEDPGKPAVNIEGMREVFSQLGSDLLNQDPEIQRLGIRDPVTREALANQEFGSSMATEFPALQKFVDRAETPGGKAILESMERIDRIARGMDPADTSRAVERKSDYLSTLGEPGGPAVTRQPALRNTEEAQNLREEIGNEEFLRRYEPVYNRESGAVSYIPRDVDKPRPGRRIFSNLTKKEQNAIFTEIRKAEKVTSDPANKYMKKWFDANMPGDLQAYLTLSNKEKTELNDIATDAGMSGLDLLRGLFQESNTGASRLQELREKQSGTFKEGEYWRSDKPFNRPPAIPESK